jgi:transcriptional regulator GlxA family with amidase domain
VTPTSAPFIVGIPVYTGVDLLDVAAPCEVFSWVSQSWDRQVKVYTIAETNGTVTTRDGLQITPHKTFGQVERVDLLWVPGGDLTALNTYMKDVIFLGELRRLSEHAAYVTSVCEGALLLASAGLLDGHRATTHWAFIACLQQFKKITVEGAKEGYPRFVVSKKRKQATRVTGAGISAGLDEAFELVKLFAGEDVAKKVQVSIQYFPAPPVKGELPKSSPCPLGAAVT